MPFTILDILTLKIAVGECEDFLLSFLFQTVTNFGNQ